MSRRRIAGLSALVWGGAALLIGECYPFTRFPMYADMAPGRSPAILVFRADGRAAEPEDYERFSGAALYRLGPPEGIPFTMGWRINEAENHIRRHRLEEGDEEGPVRFEVGYVTVRMGPSGPEVVRPFETLAEGNAWPR